MLFVDKADGGVGFGSWYDGCVVVDCVVCGVVE